MKRRRRVDDDDPNVTNDDRPLSKRKRVHYIFENVSSLNYRILLETYVKENLLTYENPSNQPFRASDLFYSVHPDDFILMDVPEISVEDWARYRLLKFVRRRQQQQPKNGNKKKIIDPNVVCSRGRNCICYEMFCQYLPRVQFIKQRVINDLEADPENEGDYQSKSDVLINSPYCLLCDIMIKMNTYDTNHFNKKMEAPIVNSYYRQKVNVEGNLYLRCPIRNSK